MPRNGKVVAYKRYLDEQEGTPVGDVWTDILPVQSQSKELLGYPTQKPLALLERIIQASSNPGDIVLDPFCGCGTAVAASEKLGRKWIGIDITHLAITLMKYRLEAMFPGIQFKVVGEPTDYGAAKQLAQDDRYQFQWWALSLIRAKPLGGQEGSKTGKKGSDKGIDGVITFIDDAYSKPKRVLVQVKSGHVKSGDIRDLVGTVQRENAALGVFITLEAPSRDMTTEAVSAGYYESPGWNQKYPRIQICTIAELLKGTKVEMPPQYGTFKQAPKVQQSEGVQIELEM
jgi:site-specific DNA-methyltransferase (adenine-specific)